MVVLGSPHYSRLHLASLCPPQPLVVEVGHGHIQQGKGHLKGHAGQ